MPYQVVPTRRLEVESARVQALLEMHDNNGRQWDVDSILVLLRDRGLTYTPAELLAIRDDLLTRGIIAEV